VQNALNASNATKYWGEIFTQYDKIPFVKKVTTDLTGYVTQKSVDALFSEMAKEETNIRVNPQARVTDLLKKVFGS
jgi:hypothetical protein